MQTKLSDLSRTAIVLFAAALVSGVMISTAVTAQPLALITVGSLVA
jgi:hypothetical protein